MLQKFRRAGRSVQGHRRFPLITAALCLSLLGGCSSAPDYAMIRPDSATEIAAQEFNEGLSVLVAQSTAAAGDYKIGPEDLLEVTLYDISDAAGEPRVVTARVSHSGFITLPHIGKVSASQMSPTGLEESLREHFLNYIYDPQISVFVREYRSYRVSVVGHVERPGVLELRGRKTLLEALALAGGLNEEAGRTVRITRETGDEYQSVLVDLQQLADNGNIELNVSLLPGDVISVPRAGMFYVEGAVTKPGAYPLHQDTTASQALATAGGIDVALANTGGTTLFRKGEDGARVPIEVDVAAIRAGEVQDFVVEADDVIVVPMSGPKFVLDRVLGLFRIGVRAAAF